MTSPTARLTAGYRVDDNCGHELCVSCRHRAERPTFDVNGRAITADDIRFMHRKLDELGAPRLCDAGLPLSLRWRLIALTKSGA